MQQTIALVLGGGGARAAYQVGVLKAIAACYSRYHSAPFSIVCGSSAGAINATGIGCYASCFHLAVGKLEWVWRQLNAEQVYQTNFTDISGHLLKLGFRRLQHHSQRPEPANLLDNTPLKQLLMRVIDFKRLDRNIERGFLKAMCIDASCYDDGQAYSFYQGHKQLTNWQRATRQGLRTQLTIEHLMASSAIPFLFPTVHLPQGYFGDGGLHQQAPLSAPIHFGADKIMVINLDSAHQENRPLSRHPSAARIGGHLLDTIFADPLNSDLERMARINQTLDFIPPQQRQLQDLRPIQSLVIKPSEDLAMLAQPYYNDLPLGLRGLSKLLGIHQNSDPSIISYVTFVPAYINKVINLGYQDGLCHIDEIKEFLNL